jgi:MYXO-CTERM domain-containing protein
MPAYWYDRSVRALLPILLVACTFNGRGPDPVAKPPPDLDRMPSEVLDKQEPGADTSRNPVLSRTEAHHIDPNDAPWRWFGCLRMLSCSAGKQGDASGALIVLAALAASRRRKRS